jgi:uncharacterized membrane protein YebE (DUF533 family)
MANFSDLIGAFMQNTMAPSGQQRAGNALEDLLRTGMASLGGGAQGGTTGAAPGSTQGGGLGDLLGQILGGVQGGPAQGGTPGAAPYAAPGTAQAGGMGDILGQVLGTVKGGLSDAAQNPAHASGIGAILGGLLGGGGDSVKGALGGGALAMLASIAFKALQGAGQAPAGGGAAAPGFNLPGLTAPETQEQEQAVEATAQVVLKGMISAAKADGQIDQAEMQRIVGKLQEVGMDEKTKAWVMREMSQPLNLDALAAEIPSQQVAAQVYAASLLAIEVDTDAERRYMAQLAQKTRVHPEVAQHIRQSMGITA